MKEVYDHYGLHSNTIDFIGHAVALYTNDEYIKKPMLATMERIKLYMYSLARYGKSPFIYPVSVSYMNLLYNLLYDLLSSALWLEYFA